MGKKKNCGRWIINLDLPFGGLSLFVYLSFFFGLFFFCFRHRLLFKMARVAGDGVALLYGTIVMLSLSWIFATLRLGVRKWKRNLGLDDWLMFAGLVSILTSFQDLG